MVTDFMQAAATDLGIELEVSYANRNHLLAIRQAEEVVKRTTRPDFVLTGNEKRSAGRIIEAADQARVNVFLFNNGFIEQEDIAKYGQPREVYPHWIGQYIPNNISAGYQIGKALIEEGLARGLTDTDGKLNIIAFAGAFATQASVDRVKGLEMAVAEYAEKVVLLQTFPGDWTEKTAAKK